LDEITQSNSPTFFGTYFPLQTHKFILKGFDNYSAFHPSSAKADYGGQVAKAMADKSERSQE